MNWKANWIWFHGPERPKNFYLFLRKTFDLDSVPESVVARVTADSRYKLYVNGEFLGRGPVRSDPRRQHYDEYDLAPHLKTGKNVIAALVHHYGEPSFRYHLGRGAFFFDSDLIVSDKTWKALPGDAWVNDIPRMGLQLEFSEIVDMSKIPEGWTAADFDDSSWREALVLGEFGMDPWNGLVAREIPFLGEHFIYPAEVMEVGKWDSSELEINDPTNVAFLMSNEKREAVDAGSKLRFPKPNIEDLLASDAFKPGGQRFQSAADKPGEISMSHAAAREQSGPYAAIDFRREVMGFPVVRVRAEKAGIVDMGYSERLTNGKVDPNYSGIRYADRFILKPGVQEIETFERRAFRYMQIDLRECAGDVVIESIGVKFSTYPVKWRGSFESSDELLNRIWHTGAYTVQLNMEDAYMDCPWRERTQWMGDLRVEGLVNYCAFGDTALIRKAIQDVAFSQRIDGITACFAPGDTGPCKPIPSFTLMWIMTIWDYYLWVGETALLNQVYPKVKEALRFFADHSDERGLATDIPYWMFIDWAEVDVRGKSTALNCLYYQALLDAARIAEVVGSTEDAGNYRQMAERLKQSINEVLFDKERGVYADCFAEGELSKVVSQQSNSVAVLFGIAPKEYVAHILDYIHDPKNKVVQPGSPYFSFYVLQALWQTGRKAEALDYIRERWGLMLEAGATTFWELWNDTASLCHGWSAGPTYDLPAHILGIQPLEPGFKRFQIAPQPLDITWARGLVPTVAGGVRVEFCQESGFRLMVVVPSGTRARVVIPDGVPKEDVRVSGPSPLSADVDDTGRPVFEVGQGTYEFRY